MINEEIKNANSLEVDIEQATPMFKQFLEIKQKYQGVVLLYRMGDFYEGFFEDAIVFNRVLGLTLTHKDGGALGKVPMAGIPVKSLNTYIPKMAHYYGFISFDNSMKKSNADYKPDYNLNKRYKEWLSDYLDINLE